jgi:signal recognition particle receptor subunit beta
LISLATETDRTLFLISCRSSWERFAVSKLVSSVYGSRSGFLRCIRKLILKGVDGVVCSRLAEERMDAKIESLYNREENWRAQGYDLNKIPDVLQLNKRDLGNVIPVEDLAAELQRKGEPVVEAVASTGTGVFDTLKAVAKQVLTELRKG